ncbi:nucleotidyl transferase AbiEii/AbiGii toxin family protein [Thermosulfurimonas sp. F29]|uniref:nucleotidyl transferase AbiEii/AbiGii toxin family protein n=1 Tax=Thermosulfurimonas sp. F29 TaxID=2867247 RepID=UPI001C83963D|nr:nucleotidyl transferase AbiEii/AbiGii toxin family protein [Thermosulfurimonas sp. F29]MBX6423242.1 nucleotidyltransferase [Thermosulfurimonas sp. F29]
MNLLPVLAKILDQNEIPYMIIGGQAVLLYGIPRLTRDIDITLGLEATSVEKLLELVERVGLQVLVKDPRRFVAETWVLPTLHSETGLRVDFIFSWSPFEQEALKRVREVIIEGYPVKFASPEDVIIHKMLAGRPRDLEDVQGILSKQKVDFERIRIWLARFSEVAGRDLVQEFDQLLKKAT